MRALQMLGRIAVVLVTAFADDRGDDSPYVGTLPAKLESVADPNLRDAKPAEPATPRPVPPVAPDEFQDEDLPIEPLADVTITGNSRIKTDDILKLIQTTAGQFADARQIERDVSALLARNDWFDNVVSRVVRSQTGPVLEFQVFEKVIVEKVSYIGNRTMTDEDLAVFTERLVGRKADVWSNQYFARQIEKRYRSEGYAHARVELEKGKSASDSEVVFRIDEGPRVVLTKFSFTGNKSIADSLLRLQLKSETPDLWTDDGLYTAASVSDDVTALKGWYHDLGYLNAQVASRVEFSPDRSRAEVAFTIDEGGRNEVRRVEFLGNVSISQEELSVAMRPQEGKFFDGRVANAVAGEIAARYIELGKDLPEVKWFMATVEDSIAMVDIVYTIEEQSPYRLKLPAPDDEPGTAPENRSSTDAAPAGDRKSKTDEADGLRDVERLDFEGVAAFDVAEIRARLRIDFDIVLAAHPANDLAHYLAVLEKQVRDGYRHCGFPDAAVHAVHDAARQRIAVRVTEGKRLTCGDVQVTGTQPETAGKIVQSITESPVEMQVLWKKGGPAPLDDGTPAAIRRRVRKAFAAAGFLTPEFEIAINPVSEGTMGLTIKVIGAGPRAAVGRIAITGTKRDSKAEVLKYLDLHEGMPFDSDLPRRLEDRLVASGRFLLIRVEAQVPETPYPRAAADVRDLKIAVHEYDKAPPLAQEFSPAEQALLQLRTWLERWSKGQTDDEVVIDGSFRVDSPPRGADKSDSDQPPAGALTAAAIAIRTVIAPNRGQTITASATRADGKPLAEVLFTTGADRIVLAAPLRQAKLVLPRPSSVRVLANIQGTSAEKESIERGEHRFRLSFGLGLNGKSTPQSTPFAITAALSPAWMISMAREQDVKCALREGIHEISSVDGCVAIRIDAASGRLIEGRFRDEHGQLSVRTGKNVFQLELDRLEGPISAATVAYEATSPWKSTVQFFVDTWRDAASRAELTESAEAIAALSKLLRLWSPPSFASLENAYDVIPPGDHEPFWIATHREGWSYEAWREPGSQAHKNLVAGLLPLFRRLVPKTGPAWPLGRDFALYWASDDPRPEQTMREPAAGLELGPAGEIFVGDLNSLLKQGWSELAGQRGLGRLTAAAFTRDWQPFFKGDSWLGEWFLSLARALRGLDESELYALGRLFPDGDARGAIVQSLALLKRDPEKPLEEILPVALDSLWVNVVYAEARAALVKLADGTGSNRRKPRRDDHFQLLSAEEDSEHGKQPRWWDDESDFSDPDPDEDLNIGDPDLPKPPRRLPLPTFMRELPSPFAPLPIPGATAPQENADGTQEIPELVP